jgi:outer membrane biosynthesis protein TonB
MLRIAIVSLALSLSACATNMAQRAAESQRRVSSAAVSAAQRPTTFPTAIEPRLPSVDRIARLVYNELGDHAAAELKLCVSPDGRVAEVAVVHRSALEQFDAAVVRDVADWEFTPRLGLAAEPTCTRATVAYRAPR